DARIELDDDARARGGARDAERAVEPRRNIEVGRQREALLFVGHDVGHGLEGEMADLVTGHRAGDENPGAPVEEERVRMNARRAALVPERERVELGDGEKERVDLLAAPGGRSRGVREVDETLLQALIARDLPLRGAARDRALRNLEDLAVREV